MKHRITILPFQRSIPASHGEGLLHALTEHGILLPAACGGRGTCGKCKVTLISGNVEGTVPDTHGQILSCHARVVEDITVELITEVLDEKVTVQDAHAPSAGIADVLLDVGTTTLAWALIDRRNGKELARGTALNPQRACGADVLTRIKAWGEGNGALLQRLVLDGVRALLEEMQKKTNASLGDMTVVGNPTMLHLFLGVDPSTIGAYPFTPVFKDTQHRRGEELALPVESVTLLPSAHAYVGSDVTAGVIATELHRTDGTELLVDVGTNGEIVLAHRGRLISTSCAAGPALEGACIECGMGGISGAICHVSESHGTLSLKTVGDATPVGICGSGLIDLIALLVREGLIDESGAWDPYTESSLASHLSGDRFYLNGSVYLSQADIRQFQLAKAAIAAGIVTLLAECDLSEEDVDHVYLAGGLGFYMSIPNAIATGLLPAFPPERIQAVGNSALAGAYRYLTVASERSALERVAAQTENLELSFSPRFSEEYVERMSF